MHMHLKTVLYTRINRVLRKTCILLLWMSTLRSEIETTVFMHVTPCSLVHIYTKLRCVTCQEMVNYTLSADNNLSYSRLIRSTTVSRGVYSVKSLESIIEIYQFL